MARLLADEDFDFAVVQRLRLLGHDVQTANEAGWAGRGLPDSAVLAFAIGQQRAVITHNRRDFIRLHSTMPTHFGIIVCTRDRDAESLATRIDVALSTVADVNGTLIRVNRPA